VPDEVLDVLAADCSDVRRHPRVEEGREPGERVDVRLDRMAERFPARRSRAQLATLTAGSPEATMWVLVALAMVLEPVLRRSEVARIPL
jgi:hypothetical protein